MVLECALAVSWMDSLIFRLFLMIPDYLRDMKDYDIPAILITLPLRISCLAQLDPSLHPLPRNMQQGIVVCTWYIHHERHGRNEVPRMVRLPEDRTEWIFRLTAAWAGVIEPDTAMALSLPSPAPVRTTHDQFVALDVIISQGLHIPRFSGLVTTHFIDDLDGNRHYTVAFSFPAQVSGHIIVDAAEVHHYCASPTDRACLIHHGWIEIPLDAEPRHRMRPGHAFL